MIISVSRRTDIPTHYFEWFLNRIKASYVLTRNPMNFKQVSKISLKPEDVTCLVFWTKNPEPMISRLDELKEYNYYVQVTLTPYQKDLETNLPLKKDIIKSIKTLSDKIGKEKVIWRYDPIIINDKYSKEYHLHYFGKMCKTLSGYVDTCVISFVEQYPKIKKALTELNATYLSESEKRGLLEKLVKIADHNSIVMKSCASDIDFSDIGVSPSSCVDGELIKKLFNVQHDSKDMSQRVNCGCISSVDIGSYDTCVNGCVYCYANRNYDIAYKHFSEQDMEAEILGVPLVGNEKITIRRTKKTSQQINLF